ncbi:TonB-dependent receptor domain-containing protein [Horticoccus sp. 23ND18S-11]|uniref:TonB-dependent receptor domain-containing protein n=1 Tax=Horticoccus sp. 23ND18S-11 TaxID=3391832 RepID=UPI0039C975C7
MKDLRLITLRSVVLVALALPATSLPGRAQTAAAAPAKPTDDVLRLEAFSVTGSNIKRLDQEKILPVTVIDKEAMQLRDASTPVQMLTAMPQVVSVPINESNATGALARGDVAAINMRGLGSGNTLVLLNGRRLASHPITQNENGVLATSVNVNQLPNRGVGRIDMLRDGASSIYGSDAVAGVVNTVMDAEFRGVEISTRFAAPEHGAGQEVRGTIVFGTDFAKGRGRFLSVLDGFHRHQVYLSDRSFSSDADKTSRAPAPFNLTTGAFFDRNATGPFPSFRVGTATATQYLVPLASGPVGFTTTAPARTGVTANYYYNINSDQMSLPRSTRYNWFNKAEFDVSDRITAFGEFSYYDSRSWFKRSPLPYSSGSDRALVVAIDNPYNPFGSRYYSPTGAANPDGTARLTGTPQTVTILSKRIMDMGQERVDITSDALRLLGGLRGRVARTWTWEAAAYYTRARTTDEVQNGLRETRLLAAAQRTDSSAFNPFGYTFRVQGGAVVTDQPYVNPANVMNPIYDKLPNIGETSIASADFRTSGEVVQLWSGALSLAVGGEYREEKLSHTRPVYAGLNPADSGLDVNDNDFIQASAASNIVGKRTVGSGYAEAVLPLVSPRNQIPLLDSFEVSAAARYENYSDFGSTTKPKYGANWRPFKWAMVRGSYNEGFRAPNLAVLNQKERRIVQAYADTYRQPITALPTDGSTNRTYVSSGNFGLTAESSKGKSFGIVVDVPKVKGLSFSADFWEIKQTNVIEADSTADILASDNALLLAYTQQQIAAGRAVGSIDVGSGTSAYKGDPRAIRSSTITPAELALFAAYNGARPTAQQIAPFGSLVSQRRAFSNRSNSTISGVDFAVNYRLPALAVGRFSIATDWSYIDQSYTTLPGGTVTDSRVNQDGAARWRSNTGITWRKDAWTAGLSGYYIGAFADTGATTDATTFNALGRPAYITQVFDQGRVNYYYRVADSLSFNAFVSHRIGGSAPRVLRGTTVRVGVTNLTDEKPPLSSDIVGYQASVYSYLALGRTWAIELTRRF